MKNSKAIPKQKLDEFKKLNSWHYRMQSSQGLDSYSNYIGPGLGDLVVVPVGRNRDSGILDESNFEIALEMLGGESKTVTVHRFGHWGCGWFELLLVDPKNVPKLKIAYKISESLDSYPVLDDSDYSERESEERQEWCEDYKSDLAHALVVHFGLPESLKDSKGMLELAYALEYEYQYYSGNDCSISIYPFREVDERDGERLVDAVKSLQCSGLELGEEFRYLAACLDIEVTTND